jgi:hypothetical protein
MGLDLIALRYHLHLKKNGVDFNRVAMLGRHTFSGISASSMVGTLKKFGFTISRSEASRMLTENDGYIEPFYRWLGSHTVDSFDASDYENATQIWDMNECLPDRYRGAYDFVYDGGTLEHVFHFTSALREAMTLPRIGGVFFSATPADSFLGHGFYQFGPDLAFEVLSERNGYQTKGVFLIEDRLNAAFHEVAPSTGNRGRVLASGAWPITMCYSGVRTGEIPARLSATQPDYSMAWKTGSHEERKRSGWNGFMNELLAGIPDRWRNSILRQARLSVAWIGGNSFWDRPSLKKREDI